MNFSKSSLVPKKRNSVQHSANINFNKNCSSGKFNHIVTDFRRGKRVVAQEPRGLLSNYFECSFIFRGERDDLEKQGDTAV